MSQSKASVGVREQQWRCKLPPSPAVRRTRIASLAELPIAGIKQYDPHNSKPECTKQHKPDSRGGTGV